MTNTNSKQPKQVQKMSITYLTEKDSDPEDQDVFGGSYNQPLLSLHKSDGPLTQVEPVAQKARLRKRQLSVSI